MFSLPNDINHSYSLNSVFCLLASEKELADKPGSVVSSHLSRVCVTTHLKRPTRIQLRVTA